MSDESKAKTKKILLGVGGGCLALILLCCMSGGGLYFMKQSSYEGGGIEHAERFLGFLQSGDTGAAFGATAYLGDTSLYSQSTFETCIRSTVIGDVTSYECDSASGSFASSDGVDVDCTVTSAAHGENVVTIHVNSPDETPYLGFIWFDATAWMGPDWHGDSCPTWSGREYFREPPPGRVRP